MIPKLNYEVYKVCVYKADDVKATLNDMIYIPENVEKYRIPHEIASNIELNLRANMLTEEEREQAKQEEKTAYNKGLTDAWEAARKIAVNTCNGGFSVKQLAEIFGRGNTDNILDVYKPSEAIAKIKAYEEAQKEIKVGDEVEFSSVTTEGRLIIGIVFEITKYSDGNWAYHLWTPFELNKNYVLIKSDFSKRLVGKTGKHYPQVEELLKAIKEGQ